MKKQVLELDLRVGTNLVFYDNINSIYITKNLIQYIDIWYHFIKDQVVKGNMDIQFVNIENQLVDNFIKALNYYRSALWEHN